MLREMYRDWPFFRATIDNAELAIAKADLQVAEKYAEVARDQDLWMQEIEAYPQKVCDALARARSTAFGSASW